MWAEWVNKALAALPGCDDALFKNVWRNNRLLFNGVHNVADSVDYYNARMVAAAIKNKEQLLISLPDSKPHRPAFLLATALLRYFLDTYPQNVGNQNQKASVLYMGADIGIREQLYHTSIESLGFDFAQAFSQQDIKRGANSIDSNSLLQKSGDSKLPNVITVYSPADPIEIYRALSPALVAIDCSDVKYLSWMSPLLNVALTYKIPVIAWSQNPFSNCILDFEPLGNTFIWPNNIQSPLGRELSALLSTCSDIFMEPNVLGGDTVEQFSVLLQNIKHLLTQLTQKTISFGPLAKDAITVHWKYFNVLETLSVPYDFYEAEAARFWGLQPITKLANVCNHFRNALENVHPLIAQELNNVGMLLKRAHSLIENSSCPLWEACINYCLEDSTDDNIRLLIFPSDSKKKLFVFALLARYNTTEEDLRRMSIRVASFNELHRDIKHEYKKSDDKVILSRLGYSSTSEIFHPTIVGLPSSVATPRLFYAFLQSKVNIILYPHQYQPFIYRQEEWSNRLGGNFSRNINTLASMSGLSDQPKHLPISKRIQIEKPIELNIDTTKKSQNIKADLCCQLKDATNEANSLFQFYDGADDEELVLTDHPETDRNVPLMEQSEEVWYEEAIKVVFSQGWYAYFASSDLLNTIGVKGLDERYVRSLRLNDRVLIIHGQQRQNLYDLIISRVHKHPSIELHIAMIRRWQEDLRIAYEQWRNQPTSPDEFKAYGYRDIDGLLKRMQGCGSKRNSYQTLNNWLSGSILCPIEQEDLMRIAGILNMGFVRQHYKLIYRAASRLRGLHRGLSNKLNRWLQDQTSGANSKNEDDIIDNELGLTFGDIRNSLLVLDVKNIEIVSGPFLRSSLGRIEKEA